MKRHLPGLLALSIAAPICLATATAHATTAAIDTQGAVMQTTAGQQAQKTLKGMFEKRQKDLDKKQIELQKARDDIDKQSRILSREALERRMAAWQKQMLELQGVFVEYNKELQKKQNEVTGPILQKVLGIVDRIAKKEGYDVVVDRQAAPYVRADVDLTERVIQMYNAGEGHAAPASAPAGSSPAPSAPPAP